MAGPIRLANHPDRAVGCGNLLATPLCLTAQFFQEVALATWGARTTTAALCTGPAPPTACCPLSTDLPSRPRLHHPPISPPLPPPFTHRLLSAAANLPNKTYPPDQHHRHLNLFAQPNPPASYRHLRPWLTSLASTPATPSQHASPTRPAPHNQPRWPPNPTDLILNPACHLPHQPNPPHLLAPPTPIHTTAFNEHPPNSTPGKIPPPSPTPKPNY